MASDFDHLCALANHPLFCVFGDHVVIDGIPGVAVVMLDTDLALGGGMQLVNGARMLIKTAEFPDITYHSQVDHNGITYLVMEMDDTDTADVREVRIARE